MGLLRDRGTPYAPQRQARPIDWDAMRRAGAAERAEVARIEEIGRQNLEASSELAQHPLNQLTRRSADIEVQVAELAAAVGRLSEQLQTITTMLEANRDG